MKKKGFTLVELLAVIAILAILVIVAMPNVLGMFNQAKSSTFVTEVQTLMDTATTKFMTEAIKPTNQGKSLEFYFNGSKKINQLSMDGADKYYYIAMDRNGKIKRVVVWDSNFCYDSKINKKFNKATSVLEKTDVVVTDVRQIKGDGSDGIAYDAANATGILDGTAALACGGEKLSQ